ncbi:MAG: alpha-ketoacid dehydrogenase subunit beta [Rhodospirillales bacterium]|nr:alpha-ketoacid dehydrogenase subunit beta [Rhodospirillales bacterium]
MNTADIEFVRTQVRNEIERAVEFAKAGTLPSPDEALDAVYAPLKDVEEPASPGTRVLAFTEAIAEALHQEMAADPDVFVMGEDVGATGGLFQCTKGLFDRFGPERVRDTPISEATFTGCGVGAAIAGLRPVVELQIFDFVTLTMDMLVNQAAKFRFMLGGKPTVPLVVRGPQGGGVRLAAQHSQYLEAWFTHVPGLIVAAPSTPYDAKGLLISAIRDDNPVIFLESKLLYVNANGPVPEAPYAIPLGKGDIKRVGRDVTLVATLAMVPRALAAAQELEKEGISVEVVDPRTLWPLDEELILSSIRKTHRLVVAQESWTRNGFGSEIVSLVVEKAFDWLDAPILRVGAPDTPMPFNDELERWAIPSQARIAEAVRQVLREI